MGTNAKNKPYCQFGKELDALARSRDVRGPYNIAHYLRDVAGYEVSGQAVSKYLYGEYLPKHALIAAFTDAFSLAPEARRKLAWVYTYGRFPQAEEDKNPTPLIRSRQSASAVFREP
jgi:hypothetical protein